MINSIKENFKGSKGVVALIIGAGTLLITVFGVAYAYFSVASTNSATVTTSTGALQSTGNVVLSTNTASLYLNLNGVAMAQDKIGSKYWATTDVSGTSILNPTKENGIYTLATVNLSSGEAEYNCTYNYDISATVNKPITDGSDEDIKITIKGRSLIGDSKVYTLKSILAGGQTLTGIFKNVKSGEPQTITIESTVENTSDTQNDFAGNSYSITLTPKTENQGLSCVIAEPDNTLATKLINDKKMWRSELDGDGYRYAGSGSATASTSPDNFICFGTTSLSECKANEEKYLYRVLGVFEDNQGNDHVRLMKYYTLPVVYQWHSINTNIDWKDSALFNGLNGSYFLTNTRYNYLQQSSWLNKISNWNWISVNTKASSEGPNYYNDYTPSNMYFHELNRSSKTSNIGEWTTVNAKIGLINTSDYCLSLGEVAKNMTTNAFHNKDVLKTGWLNPRNNAYGNPSAEYYYLEWSISRTDYDGSVYGAWMIPEEGFETYGGVAQGSISVRPHFYLESSVLYKSGTGDYTDPIIIE